ncbi:MAG: hypothetical protein JJ975_05940 [Bacteroidia bacterium]|nr:hypothetical protein [Bacteroidia bacterium]
MKDQITWNNIEITIEYKKSCFKAVKDIHGYDLAHVQVTASQPLPITKTGYRSCFLANSIIEEHGGVINFVQAYLDEEARNPEWKKLEAKNAQLSLF